MKKAYCPQVTQSKFSMNAGIYVFIYNVKDANSRLSYNQALV